MTIAHHGSALPDNSYGGNAAGFVQPTDDGNVYFAMDRRPDTTAWEGWEVTVVGPDELCPMVFDSADAAE